MTVQTPLAPSSISEAEPETHFQQHYIEWRAARVREILRLFGERLDGMTILELGCGTGELGRLLAERGAKLTFVEGRPDHVAVLKAADPQADAHVADLNQGWPTELRRPFDLVLHLGLLYHLEDHGPALAHCARFAGATLLESEVIPDSGDVAVVISEKGYDQSLTGRSQRASPNAIERTLSAQGLAFARLRGPRLNAGFHRYDAPLIPGQAVAIGTRRMWLCAPKGREGDLFWRLNPPKGLTRL